MPKMKTHRGAAKRFKITPTGKIRRRRAFAEPHPREEVAEAEAPSERAGRDGRRVRQEAHPPDAGQVAREE